MDEETSKYIENYITVIHRTKVSGDGIVIDPGKPEMFADRKTQLGSDPHKVIDYASCMKGGRGEPTCLFESGIADDLDMPERTCLVGNHWNENDDRGHYIGKRAKGNVVPYVEKCPADSLRVDIGSLIDSTEDLRELSKDPVEANFTRFEKLLSANVHDWGGDEDKMVVIDAGLLPRSIMRFSTESRGPVSFKNINNLKDLKVLEVFHVKLTPEFVASVPNKSVVRSYIWDQTRCPDGSLLMNVEGFSVREDMRENAGEVDVNASELKRCFGANGAGVRP